MTSVAARMVSTATVDALALQSVRVQLVIVRRASLAVVAAEAAKILLAAVPSQWSQIRVPVAGWEMPEALCVRD